MRSTNTAVSRSSIAGSSRNELAEAGGAAVTQLLNVPVTMPPVGGKPGLDWET